MTNRVYDKVLLMSQSELTPVVTSRSSKIEVSQVETEGRKSKGVKEQSQSVSFIQHIEILTIYRINSKS
jgi:hypothetical protein